MVALRGCSDDKLQLRLVTVGVTASHRHIWWTIDVHVKATYLCLSWRHAWVASVLDGGEWLAWRPRHFAARATAPDTRTRRGSLCGRASLDALEKTKLLPVAAFCRLTRGLVTTSIQTELCSASMAVIYIQKNSFCKTIFLSSEISNRSTQYSIS